MSSNDAPGNVSLALKELKRKLGSSMEGSSSTPPLTVLKDIASLPDSSITVSALSSTQIGKVVQKLKSDESRKKWGDETGDMARLIVKRWKKIAKGEMPSKPLAPKPVDKSASSIGNGDSKPSDDPSDASAKSLAAGLNPPMRGKIFLNLRTSLLCHTTVKTLDEDASQLNTLKMVATESAKLIEEAVSLKFPKHDKDYIAKARQLNFNLKKNADLTNRILTGEVTPDGLTRMTSEQLATKEKIMATEKAKKEIEDSRRLDWETENEDKMNEQCGIKGDLLNASLFTCGRCKSIKTTSTQKQTRSADEPMTVFVLCKNCGNRWKC